MEPTPGRVYSKIGRRKVQVVYYLHRGDGHVEHPHLVEGFLPPSQEGLRLKDFKNWLSVMRGRGMPDSFSWSYKRSYKAGYIWQDLSSDDLIHPLQKNEYVLMGSKLQSDRQESKSCNCSRQFPDAHVESMQIGKRQSFKEKFKLNEILEEGICMKYMKECPATDSPKKRMPTILHAMKSDCGNVILCSDSFKVENLHTSVTSFSDCDDVQRHEAGHVELPANVTKPASAVHVVSTMVHMPAGTVIGKQSGEVKVYKAKEAEQTTDAATQTGESKRCSTEEATTPPGHFHPPAVEPLVMTNHHHQEERFTSSSSSLHLFTPSDANLLIDGHEILLKAPSQGVHLAELDLYTNGQYTAMLNVSGAASNNSDVFYSPSSVHSSCTVLETVSPGSVRSLASVNSICSTRFSSNQLPSTADDHHHSATAGHDGSPPVKTKLRSSTHILKQLLSCGSVDISESSILNLKAMSLPICTPFNTSPKGTPMEISHGRQLCSRNHSPHVLDHHQPYVEAMSLRPTSPKLWLCRPCHSSCFTPLEANCTHHGQPTLSREGSPNDINMLTVASRSRSPRSRSPSLAFLHFSPPPGKKT